MKLVPKVTQRYVVSKIATFETQSAMSHSRNSIFQLDLQLDLTKYSQNITIFVKGCQAGT